MLGQFGQFGAELERRMQNRTLMEYRNKRNWLLREIQRCEKNIIKIKSYVNEIQKLYEKDKINYEQYIQLISSKHEGKTLSQWIEYKEKLEKEHKEHIENYKKEIPSYIILILLALFGIGLVVLGKGLEGLSGITGHVAEEVYDFGVPIEINESEIITIFNETSNETFGIQAPAKIIDDSFACNPSTIEVGEFANCTGQYDNSGDSFATVCNLYASVSGFLTDACGSKNLKVVAVDVSGASSANCVNNNNGSISCTNWPNTADNQVINWTIEGCSATVGDSVTTITGCGSTLNAVATVVVNAATTTTSTSSTSSSSTLPHANLTLYLRNSTGVESYRNITAATNESINITSSEPYPADVNMTLYVMDYAGINQSRNISKSFLQNFTTFWTTGSFLVNITWEGNLTFFGNSTAFWVDVLATTTTSSSTSSSSTSSSTLPRANLTLYLRNSTGVESYRNITAATNESINITSSEPYPADVNMTLYVMDYAGINQSRNTSKSFLQNFTTFWTEGNYLINITWEGNLTIQPNSTAFYVTVLATTTTSSSSSTLPKGYFELWLNGTKNANLTTYTNNSVNITVNSLTPADANTTLFLTNYVGVNVSFNYSKSFLENITNFWTDGNFLANISWEGNLTYFGNSTAFYVTVIATSTSTTSTTLNAIPVISDISGIGTQTISEQTQTYVTLYFNVSDSNGAGNINGSRAKAQFNQSTTYRTNTSCNSLGAVNSSTMRFECILDVWYFDANDWGYNVSIFDNDSNYAEDTNQVFSIGQTRGMAMSSTALTFPTVTLGTGNISATNDPIIINNSGNVDIALGRMNVTSYNLHGLTTTGEFISATNFTVNNTDSCAGSVGGIQLANNTRYILTQNYMNSGNVSLGGFTNTTSYFCLWNVPSSGISGQVYDTSASVAWEVRVF